MANNKIKKIGLSLIALVVLSGAFTGGFFAGHSKGAAQDTAKAIAYSPQATQAAADSSTTGAALDFNLYWQIWDDLQSNYVDKTKVTDQALFYGSLKGLAEAAGDPYTVFMDPKEAKDFASGLSGKFDGIGAEVGMRNNIITIIAPLDGTPAKAAGLRAGDKIYAINGQSTVSMTVDEAVNLIRGDKGTKVTITIIRGTDKPKDYTITRDTIIVKSVTTTMRPDGLMVIRVSSFGDDTVNLFNQAVSQALTKNPKGIILDLRNNPGGYLESAVALASAWVPEGPVVAEQFGGNKRNEYPALGHASLQNFPTVVLVNGGSASASEILAGALRDYKKATLVGETTFGKGSVQTLEDFTDGSALKVTIARWLTPAGDFINEKGLKPNVEVVFTQANIDKNQDPQMDKAVQILTTKKK